MKKGRIFTYVNITLLVIGLTACGREAGPIKAEGICAGGELITVPGVQEAPGEHTWWYQEQPDGTTSFSTRDKIEADGKNFPNEDIGLGIYFERDEVIYPPIHYIRDSNIPPGTWVKAEQIPGKRIVSYRKQELDGNVWETDSLHNEEVLIDPSVELCREIDPTARGGNMWYRK